MARRLGGSKFIVHCPFCMCWFPVRLVLRCVLVSHPHWVRVNRVWPWKAKDIYIIESECHEYGGKLVGMDRFPLFVEDDEDGPYSGENLSVSWTFNEFSIYFRVLALLRTAMASASNRCGTNALQYGTISVSAFASLLERTGAAASQMSTHIHERETHRQFDGSFIYQSCSQITEVTTASFTTNPQLISFFACGSVYGS